MISEKFQLSSNSRSIVHCILLKVGIDNKSSFLCKVSFKQVQLFLIIHSLQKYDFWKKLKRVNLNNKKYNY